MIKIEKGVGLDVAKLVVSMLLVFSIWFGSITYNSYQKAYDRGHTVGMADQRIKDTIQRGDTCRQETFLP